MQTRFDSVLFVGFGGPTAECCGRITPCPGNAAECFVRSIVGVRPGAEERIAQVAAHYARLGGYSPYNAFTLQQANQVAQLLRAQGLQVPVHVGMRHWPPYVRDVLTTMVAQGLRQPLGLILSPFQCAASWEQYQQTVAAGLATLGAEAPEVTYLEPWYDHPGFGAAIAQVVRAAQQQLAPAARQRVATIYTAHSIPEPMAAQAPYAHQFAATAAAAAALLADEDYRLAYQSQATGTPFAWLQPDISDAIQQAADAGYQAVVVAPIGFLCDHVEVLYDLDVQARQTAQDCGLQFARAATVGNHPIFLEMLSTLLTRRLRG